MIQTFFDICKYQIGITRVLIIRLHFCGHILYEVAEFCEHERYPEVLHVFENSFHISELNQIDSTLGEINHKHRKYFVARDFYIVKHLTQANTVLNTWHINNGY
jgi:hypothetical protein